MSGVQKQQSQLPQPQNADELVQVLVKLAGYSSNTEEIKMATEILKVFLRKPNCVAPLMTQIQGHSDAGIRQIAAVLLRRKIVQHFRKVNDNMKQELKKTLLDRLVQEELRPVRLSVAALISELAQSLVPKNQWPELLQFLLQCSGSEKSGHREVAMLLFRALADTIGPSLRPHFDTLLQIFVRGLSDPEPSVRSEALKALGVLAEEQMNNEEDEAGQEHIAREISKVVPLMVNAVKQCLIQGDEEAATMAFETFDNLAESPVNVLVPHLPVVVGLMAEITANRQMTMNTRDKASLFIAQVCENKPGKVVKLGLVGPLLDMCFHLAVEPFPDGEDFETTETTAQKIAVEILDGLALNTPKRFIYDNSIQKMMALLQDPNENNRKGGLVILAVLCEGLCEMLKPDMLKFLEVIVSSTQDPSSLVRSAAAVGITQFSEYLQPEIMDLHHIVVPTLFRMLDQQQANSVKKRALDALDSYCERLGPDIAPYVEPAMERLGRELIKPGQTQDLQEATISAIRSVAKSADDQFSPFFASTINVMATLMTRTEDEMLGLRSVATECVGALACAVGKEKFAPFLQDAVKLAIGGMALEHYQLRESTYLFFQSLCEMLGPDFHPLLSTVMPLLLASCQSYDGIMEERADDGFGGGGAVADLSDPDEEDEGDDDGDNARTRTFIRSGALDEKMAAVQCLGTIASACGAPFVPYLNDVLEELDCLITYPHHHIRQICCGVFSDIISLMYTVFPNPQQWTAGVAVPLHPTAAQVLAVIVKMATEQLRIEEHKAVASLAVQALTEACKKFGPAVIQEHLADLNEMVLTLIMEKAICQQEYDDDDPERADHDEVLIDDVTSLVGVLAQIYGPSYDEVFQQMYPSLMKFCAEHRPAEDRLMTIGCIAEVAEATGDKIVKYMNDVFPIVFTALGDQSAHVRRNSAYCLGALCAAAGPQLYPEYGRCLNALRPLFVIPADVDKYERERLEAARDNATSVVAKMIRAGASALPMEEVTPVFLNACPLTADLEEGKFVYPVICDLFDTHTPLMMANLGAAVNAIAGALVPKLVDMLENDTRQRLVVMTKKLQQLGPQLEAVVAQLSEDRRNAFIAAMNS